MGEGVKQCRVCLKEKPLDSFFRHSQTRDKRHSYCKECFADRTRLYRANNPDRARRAAKKYNSSVNGVESKRKSRALYRKNYPEKIKAVRAVERAVKRGDLKKMPCEICKSLKVEAHHEDYSNALSVRWLCTKHHKEAHGVKLMWN